MKNRLLERIADIKELQDTAALYKNKKGCVLTGLDGTIKALYLCALKEAVAAGTLVLLVPGRDAVREYRQTLAYLYPDVPVQEFYPTNLPRVTADSRNLEIQAGRAAALRMIAGEETGIVFVTAEALLQKQARPSGLSRSSLQITAGETLEQGMFMERLAEMGYERTDEVDTIGQFSVRGGIIDVFPLNSLNPARIEWFDADIDGIRLFDVNTKRSLENTETLKIVPLKTRSEEAFDAFLREYGASDTLFVMDEPSRFKEMLDRLYKEGQEYKDILTSSCQCYLKLNDDLPLFRGFGDSNSQARKNVCRLAYDYLKTNNLLSFIRREIRDPNRTGAEVVAVAVGKLVIFGVTVPAFFLLAMVCLLKWIWGNDYGCHGYTAICSLDFFLRIRSGGISVA